MLNYTKFKQLTFLTKIILTLNQVYKPINKGIMKTTNPVSVLINNPPPAPKKGFTQYYSFETNTWSYIKLPGTR